MKTKNLLIIGGVVLVVVLLVRKRVTAATDPLAAIKQNASGQSPHAPDPFGSKNPGLPPDPALEGWFATEYGISSKEGPAPFDGPGGENPMAAQEDFLANRL